MTRLSHSLPGRAARPGVLGAVVLTAALAAAGCGASSSSSGSGTSQNTSQSSAFRQCLERHGVTPPQGHPPGGTGVPHPRPTGSAAGSFRQAVQACGGLPRPRRGVWLSSFKRGIQMFITYLLRELRRRMRQAIFIAAGLALGVGLVITVTAASDGVSATQGTVLHSLYGVGTDVTVTQSPTAGSCGGTRFNFAGGQPGQQPAAPASAGTSSPAAGWERSSPRRSPRCSGLKDVSGAVGALVLNDVKLSGTLSAGGGQPAPGGGEASGPGRSAAARSPSPGSTQPMTRWGRSAPARSPRGTTSPRPSRTRTSPWWTPTTPRRRTSRSDRAVTVAGKTFSVIGIVQAAQGE